MTRKQRRFAMIATGMGVLAVAVFLMLFAIRDAMFFFHSPTDIVEKHIAPGTRIRLGGMVASGTLFRGEVNSFEVTDGNRGVAVTYHGILPDLVRDGQGVVVEGMLDDSGVFTADNVLAKHDETYMPKEVADALKKGNGKNEAAAGKSSAVEAQSGLR
jgi:cytochrome c-type biogenesis protein CcmE